MFCCLGMSVRSLWIKAKMFQNHCDLQYSLCQWPLGQSNMLQNHCDLQYSCCPGVSVRGHWIKTKMLQNLCDLQYSVAWWCLSEVFGSKQKCCKTIVIYSILLPGGVCQRHCLKAKKCNFHCRVMLFLAFGPKQVASSGP